LMGVAKGDEPGGGRMVLVHGTAQAAASVQGACWALAPHVLWDHTWAKVRQTCAGQPIGQQRRHRKVANADYGFA